MKTQALFISIMLVCVVFGASMTSANAQSPAPHRWWTASDRAAGRNEIDLAVAPLRAHVSLHYVPVGRYALTISVMHTGADTITQLRAAVSGVNTRCTMPAFSNRLASGGHASVEVVCENIRSAPESDAIWDLNEPLALHLEFEHGGSVVSRTIPVGYVRYAGWATSYDYHDAGVLMMLMSRESALALDAIVANVRGRAEHLFGRSLDDSVPSRLAAARAIADYVLASGLRYNAGGESYFGPYPSANTTSFPAELLAYGYGACTDFAVLGGFLLRSLGVPYGIFTSPGHAATFVEIARTRIAGDRPFANSLEAPCGTDRCSYLALDLSRISVAASTDAILRESREMFVAPIEEPYEVISSSDVGLVVPQGTLLGRTWLGNSVEVLISALPTL